MSAIKKVHSNEASAVAIEGKKRPSRPVRLRMQELIADALDQNARRTGNPDHIAQAKAFRASLEKLRDAATGWRGPISRKALDGVETAVWSGQLDPESQSALQHLLTWLRVEWEGDQDGRTKFDTWRCAAVAATLQRRRPRLGNEPAVKAAIAALFPHRLHDGKFRGRVDKHRQKAMRGELPASFSLESLAPRTSVTAALAALEKLTS